MCSFKKIHQPKLVHCLHAPQWHSDWPLCFAWSLVNAWQRLYYERLTLDQLFHFRRTTMWRLSRCEGLQHFWQKPKVCQFIGDGFGRHQTRWWCHFQICLLVEAGRRVCLTDHRAARNKLRLVGLIIAVIYVPLLEGRIVVRTFLRCRGFRWTLRFYCSCHMCHKSLAFPSHPPHLHSSGRTWIHAEMGQ